MPAPSVVGAGRGWWPHIKHGMARLCLCFAWLSPGWAPQGQLCVLLPRGEDRAEETWGLAILLPPPARPRQHLLQTKALCSAAACSPPLAFLLSLSLLHSLPRIPLLNLVPQNLQQSRAEHQASFSLPSPSNRKARQRLPTQKGAYLHGLCCGCGLGPRARTLQRQGNTSLEARLVLHRVSYMLFFLIR